MFDIYHTILNLLINTCIIVFDQSIPVAYMYTCTIIAGWVGGWGVEHCIKYKKNNLPKFVQHQFT